VNSSVEIACVIPARGGSKRIPRKNIKDFLGKPLIGRVITTAISSNIFSRVIVSTEDKEIASIAQDFGAEVPFVRPIELADDISPTIPVVRQAISATGMSINERNIVCCLYPTAVLTSISDLQEGYIKYAESDGSKMLMALARYPHPIQRAYQRDNNGEFLPLDEKSINLRTQDLQPNWHDAGQFYFGSVSNWFGERNHKHSLLGIEIPHSRIQDIDTLDDWIKAEYIFKWQEKK